MGKHFWAWLVVVAVGLCLSGCKSAPSAPSYSSDPLLISKKPVEGKAAGAQPILVANRGPVPPLPFDGMEVLPAGGAATPDDGSLPGSSALSGNQGQKLTSALRQELHQ